MSLERELAIEIVTRLQRERHVAYFAGGCVRDALLGLEPKDYDVATSALPQQVKQALGGGILVGEAFGVIRYTREGVTVEIATFRAEWGYDDRRRPSQVVFTDAEHDAQRRDFTVNALFEDPLTGQVIDYVGGRADLHAKLLRAVGDPRQRFDEDALRLLRAVRFAVRLGFVIEPDTAGAIRERAGHLNDISRERIGMELRLMLSEPTAAHAVALLEQLRLDGPTLGQEPHRSELAITRRLTGHASWTTALTAWLLDRGGVSVEAVREALCLSNDETAALRGHVHRLPLLQTWATLTLAQRKRLLAEEGSRETLRLIDDAAVVHEAMHLLASGVAPAPLVTGSDLVAAGVRPGPGMGQRLAWLYDLQLEGVVTTREQAIARIHEHP